jgi:hypothetical protein
VGLLHWDPLYCLATPSRSPMALQMQVCLVVSSGCQALVILCVPSVLLAPA